MECVKTPSNVKYLNQEAADLMLQNRPAFISRVKECVAQSKAHLYDEPPSDDPHFIAFEKYDNEIHGSTLERIKTNKYLIGASPASSGLSWVKEGEFKALSIE